MGNGISPRTEVLNEKLRKSWPSKRNNGVGVLDFKKSLSGALMRSVLWQTPDLVGRHAQRGRTVCEWKGVSPGS